VMYHRTRGFDFRGHCEKAARDEHRDDPTKVWLTFQGHSTMHRGVQCSTHMADTSRCWALGCCKQGVLQ
jgi:hypothetical protein